MEKPILYNSTSQPPFLVHYNLIRLPCPSALSIAPSFSVKDSCIHSCTRNSKFKSPYSQFRLYRNKDGHFHTELKNKSSPRTDLILVSCQDQEPIKKDQKQGRQSLLRFFLGFEKLGKNLKENLSPKQKGDWKDLMLMSLSFAVYVYISQRIVCAYCAWTSMANHSW